MTEVRARAVPPTALVAARWNPDLHPRGHDGKFIETFGLIWLIDMAGFRHGQRGDKRVQGEVQEIIPDPHDPGNPIIRVKMTDPRWDASAFGETYDARSYQVSSRDPSKATIPDKPTVDLAGELLPEGKEPYITIPPVMPPDDVPPVIESTTGVGVPLAPMEKPADWDAISLKAKHEWVTAQMEGDLTAMRGMPTVFNLDGTNPEVEFNLANRYRELTNIDMETALWVDGVVTNKSASLMEDELVQPTSAIAVAHPGTKHPGGIGPITNRKAIVLNQAHFQDDKTWDKEKAMSKGGSLPWSAGGGDPTATMVHEFGHHRQFRYFASTMLEAGQPFSKIRQPDGFGLMPDSSNWPEVQQARYDIQKLAPSQYGQSKSSEAFAEVWSGVVTGYVPISPELQSAWDTWHDGMDIPDQMPPTRYTPDELVDDDDESLTPEELDAYWAEASALLKLPGMREHYPLTAKKSDAWAAGTVYAESEFGEPTEFPSENLVLWEEAAMKLPPDQWNSLDVEGNVWSYHAGEDRYMILNWQGEWVLYKNGVRMRTGDSVAELQQGVVPSDFPFPEGTLVDFRTKGVNARGYVVGVEGAHLGENALLLIKSGKETIPRRVRNVKPVTLGRAEDRFTFKDWLEGARLAPAMMQAPPDFIPPMRSTLGAEHPMFEEEFHLLLDELEERHGTYTSGRLTYVGTGLDETGRQYFRDGLQAQIENEPFWQAIFTGSTLVDDLKNLDAGASIWDLDHMQKTYGQVVSTPDRIIMLINPTIDPTLNSRDDNIIEHEGLALLESVMAHEYGHAVHRSVQQELQGYSPVRDIRNVDLPQTFDSYFRAWTQYMGANSPTDYGDKNDPESVAENFVRYHYAMEGDAGWDRFLERIEQVRASWYPPEEVEAVWGEPDSRWVEDVAPLQEMIAEVAIDPDMAYRSIQRYGKRGADRDMMEATPPPKILEYHNQIVALDEFNNRVGQITWEMKEDPRAFSDDEWEQALGDHNGRYYEVDSLFVDPEYRRKGYGTALFNAFKEMAERKLGPKGWSPGEFTRDGSAFWQGITGETVNPTKRIDVKTMDEAMGL